MQYNLFHVTGNIIKFFFKSLEEIPKFLKDSTKMLDFLDEL